MQTLQPEEITRTREVLSKLEPDRLPLDIFTETCRLTVTPVLEVVCLRKNNERLEVALLKRPENDLNWPGMYHVPGSVITPTDVDNDLDRIVGRICKTKLKLEDVGRPVFVINKLCRVKRGIELAVVFVIEVKDNISNAEFYDVEALPDNLIEGHDFFIAEALNSIPSAAN